MAQNKQKLWETTGIYQPSSDQPWAGDDKAGRTVGAECKPLNSRKEEPRRDSDAIDVVAAFAAIAGLSAPYC